MDAEVIRDYFCSTPYIHIELLYPSKMYKSPFFRLERGSRSPRMSLLLEYSKVLVDRWSPEPPAQDIYSCKAASVQLDIETSTGAISFWRKPKCHV